MSTEPHAEHLHFFGVSVPEPSALSRLRLEA